MQTKFWLADLKGERLRLDGRIIIRMDLIK
jgi:hypothetical protein